MTNTITASNTIKVFYIEYHVSHGLVVLWLRTWQKLVTLATLVMSYHDAAVNVFGIRKGGYSRLF